MNKDEKIKVIYKKLLGKKEARVSLLERKRDLFSAMVLGIHLTLDGVLVRTTDWKPEDGCSVGIDGCRCRELYSCL